MKLARIFAILKEAEMGEAPAIPATDVVPSEDGSTDSSQVKTIEQVWEENKTTTKTYISKEEFQVRQVGNNFEVYSLVGSTRTLYKNMDQATLNATFQKVREEDVPGADGFVAYLRPNTVEAFKFKGNSTMVLIGKNSVPLVSQDYVIKSVSKNEMGQDEFVFSIEPQFQFENTKEITQ